MRDPFGTFADTIRHFASVRPDAKALTFGDACWTFADLDAVSSRAAQALQAAGVGHGDRVAVLSRNRAEFFELIVACSKIGAIMVGLNWRLAPAEIATILADAAPSILFYGPDEKDLAHSACADIPGIDAIGFGDDYDAWRDAMPPVDPGHAGTPDETILILYTSGTTGLPKGVMLTNLGMSYTRRLGEAWGMTGASVNLVCMPMFHIGGCGYGSSTMMMGGHTVLMREVNPAQIVELIEKHRVTNCFLVPTVVQAVLGVPGIEKADLSSLELLMYGAAPIGDALLRRALEMLDCGFMHAYGMTEASGTVIFLPPEDHDLGGPRARLLKSCGRAVPWVELKIVDPATAAEVPTGEVGEIWLRSSMLMKGYWNKPEASAQALAGGWYRTGDAASKDADGYVFIVDRFKDMIISGGENIYPAEIENVLGSHPAIREVGVIGVSHERWGETPLAVVALKEGAAAGADDLIDFVRGRLARYKCPTRIEFVDALPRNASGKLLKHEMRRIWPQKTPVSPLSLARRWVNDYFNRHDAKAAAEFIAPGYTLEIGDVVFAGRDESWLPAVAKQMELFPGLGMTVHRTAAGRDWAAAVFSEHGASKGKAAVWSGIAIWRSDGQVLTGCIAQEDYMTRQRQLKAGVADAPEPPAVAPWDAEPKQADPAAEAVVRAWLAGGSWPKRGVRCDDEHITGTPLEFDIDATDIVFMASSGEDVVFHARQWGSYRAGLPKAPPVGRATLYVNGIVQVREGSVVSGRVIRDRLGLQAALMGARP